MYRALEEQNQLLELVPDENRKIPNTSSKALEGSPLSKVLRGLTLAAFQIND